MATLLSELIDFINEVEIGGEIRRKDLNSYVSNSVSVDQYRRRMTILGYLETIGLGVYRKLKDIPENMTSTELEYAYKNRRVMLTKHNLCIY